MLRNLPNPGRLPVLVGTALMGALLLVAGLMMKNNQETAVAAALVATQTALAPTGTPGPSPTPTDTPTLTPTGTLPPTGTPAPTGTPGPTAIPPLRITIDTGGYPTPSEPPSTPIPPPVEPVEIPQGVVNVMLLGTDKRSDDVGFRTDTIIIASVNIEENSVNMLSIPRDLMVYVPGWTMRKINTAYQRGEAVGWRGGGAGLLRETILYNLGIRVDYYALIDLNGFQDVVDILGGIEVPVDCAVEGWILKEPRKRQSDFASYQGWVDYTGDESNWVRYTLPIGVHEFDGYEALWYARYRIGTSDFDRAYRQQQVLRAILRKATSIGFTDIDKIPGLWQQYNDLVQTDMGPGNMLVFGPVAANIDDIAINSYVLTPDMLTHWYDITQEQSVFLLNQDGSVERLMSLAMVPPSQNYLLQNTATVEIRNGTAVPRLDEVAAFRISQLGLHAAATGNADSPGYIDTVIYDFTGREKAGQLVALQRQLRVADAEVIVQPDPNRQYDYVVILGQDYTSCSRNITVPDAPRPTNTPDPENPDAALTVTPGEGTPEPTQPAEDVEVVPAPTQPLEAPTPGG